ncbi:MAG: hypothetical protein LBF27_22240 [Sphingobacterium sp.]|jgi:hypothetical protein|nr:hypothetical protein [Sphingobacterium sp.]
MKTLKSKIIAGVSALTLLLGSFFIVNAIEKKDGAAKAPKQMEYRWFRITSNYSPGNPVSSSDAVYIRTSATPPSDDCPTGSNNQCVSGFLPGQTTASGSSYVLSGTSQTPNPSAPHITKN